MALPRANSQKYLPRYNGLSTPRSSVPGQVICKDPFGTGRVFLYSDKVDIYNKISYI